MKKFLTVLLVITLIFGVVACGNEGGGDTTVPNQPEQVAPDGDDSKNPDQVTPDGDDSKNPDDSEDVQGNVIFESNLSAEQEVATETVAFQMTAKNSETNEPIAVTVIGIGAKIQKETDGTYQAILQSGDNVIVAEVQNGEQTVKQDYKIVYKKVGVPRVSLSLKEGLFQSDRFGFSIKAYDSENKAIAPSFQWLKGTPSGSPLAQNGNIEVGFWTDGAVLSESGDAPEVCEQYSDGTAVSQLAYVAWADAGTENVYYKVNMPDSKPQMSGWFVVRCEDAAGIACTVLVQAEYKRSDDPNVEVGSVTFALEVFTLGGGYIVEPVQVPYRASDNNATLLIRVMNEYGYKIEHTGTAEANFYFSVLYNGDAAEASNLQTLPEGVSAAHMAIPAFAPEFPECLIGQMMNDGAIFSPDDLYGNFLYETYFDETGAEYLAGLGEFDYFNTSGWMYSVNGEFPGVGASATVPNDGDVIRWQFTLYGLGMDIGGGMAEDGNIFGSTDKTLLTKKIAEINTKNAQTQYGQNYDDAIAVLQKLDALQEEVDSALRNLTK